MKHWFTVLALLSAFGLQANAVQKGEPQFNNNIYLTVYRGTDHGVQAYHEKDGVPVPGDSGVVMDKNRAELGRFHLISSDNTESVALLTGLEPGAVNRIRHLKFDRVAEETADKSQLQDVRFAPVDGSFYFVIDRAKYPDIKVRSKGQITKSLDDETVYGIFKVIGEDEQYRFAIVTSNAPGVDYREAEGLFTQSYADQVLSSTGFVNISYKNLLMLFVGGLFIWMGIFKDWEPLLLVPIGFGILVGNIPLPLSLFNSISVYMIDPVSHQYVFNTTSNSVLGMIYFGVRSGIFPPLIFLGIGAMTDFSALLANPKSVLLGAAAQVGIFITFICAILFGFTPENAAAIGIIGGADGPTAIFLSSKLAPSLIGPIAIAAYSYMAMVPIIQPPIMKLLTTRKERLIKMKAPREVTRTEKILFPVIGMVVTTLVAPGAIPLLGMLFFGNLLKESGVTTRLAKTAANALIDICTILLGLAVGASTSAQVFLNEKSVFIFVLGVISFGVATAGGVLFAKFMNLFVREKFNPLIGAAGVSAVPDSARVAHNVGKAEDPSNYLLMHAMGPNVACVIGSAIAAGVFLGIF